MVVVERESKDGLSPMYPESKDIRVCGVLGRLRDGDHVFAVRRALFKIGNEIESKGIDPRAIGSKVGGSERAHIAGRVCAILPSVPY